ncbi:MAG: hypothetical protein JO112_04655 [Planctomycetes bacterium]|nr:hypothetical protein [Planctomycetota bacterium]
MRIRGIDGLTPAQVEEKLATGCRFVFYEFCISLIFVTLRRPTDVFLLKKDELGLWRGLPYTAVSLLLGWWGIPMGIIYTPLTILTNLSGGRDVTAEIRPLFQSPPLS